jgi:PAS domain S-box-containing protein
MFFKTSSKISQEYTESIISTIHEPLIILDRNFRVISASRSFYNIFKLKAEETEGQIIYDLGNKQWDIPGLRDLMEKILLSESAYDNFEIDNIFPDTGRRVILLNARKIQIKSDKDRVILLAINDITSKRISEEKLVKLADVEKSAGDAVIVINPDGIIESWNNGAETAYGYTAADVIGRSISLLMFPGYSSDFKELLVRGCSGETSQMYETQRIKKSGQTANVLLIISPVKNKSGIVIGDSIVARDIIDSSEIEIQLEKALEKLEIIKIYEKEAREFPESIINTMSEPLMTLDKNLRVVSVNRSYTELFMVDPDEIIGNFIYDIGDKQWNIPRLRELLETILSQNSCIINYEVEFVFPNIGRRIILLNAREIMRAAGKEQTILMTFENITARKDIESGLEKTRKELEVIKNTADEISEFAESIINTVREPLISLDQDLRVVTVSRSFYEVFKVRPEETVGQLIYDLGNKQWDIPQLRELLETILPQQSSFENYEVEHDFTTIGRRIMLLNARQIQRASGKERIILLAIEDITNRREIENGLEKTRKELEIIKKTADEVSEFAESIINTVREPLIALDQNLRVVTVSRSFYEVFKVNPEETVGQLIYDLGNKQWDIPRLRELLETILPQQSSFENYEVEHDFTTIGRRIMLLNARQIQRASGKERIILLAIEDITERKVIEAGLEKTRKELEVIKKTADEVSEYAESLINTVREPLISLDQNLRVVSVSRSFYEFFKVNPEETIGQLIYDLGNKQWDIPQLRELLETILPKKASFDNYEVEHDFTTIGRRIMLLNARQIQRASGKEKIILLAIEDITERKEIEIGLEKTRKELEATKISEDESREYAESMIDTVREPLIVLDQDLRVVTASRSFYEVFKVNPAETMEQLIYDLGNKQWDIPKLRELLETILPLKATFDNYEVEHDFTTIGSRIMLLNARQIQRVSGKERIILLAIEDITERREIENGLEKAHDELKALATELKRTAQVKSEFLANMSHELRTPLNSINGFSEVLFDETFGPLNEKQKKYVHNVLTSGKHLLLLINQILDMAKVEAGKMTLALSSLPMKSLLNEISMLVADMVSKKKLHMFVEIAEDLPDIEADELKVKEIIYNLLSNVVKFTPEGGKIGMRAKKVDSGIEIIVWDTGVGIASENMEKIFEGFFRVDTPFSRVTEGTGLGLPLSKKLVELHGGMLTVESEGLNLGTSVRFTLPLVSVEAH